MTGRICSGVFYVFCALYVLALLLFLIGTFASEDESLAGVFLVPLGLPWNLKIDRLFPEPLWPWAAALAPILNIALIRLICKLIHRA